MLIKQKQKISRTLYKSFVRSLKKFGPDRFSRCDVYWIQTNRQAKFIYRLYITRLLWNQLTSKGNLGPIFFFTFVKSNGQRRENHDLKQNAGKRRE